eukprot:TRINITY_DN42474_c0_g1_i1.p1 TRINITY_DN42474_c0_g1~~TRINITY_DN42474_c0_g1_i1.p1  ORF type:complete len:103 (-),score=1.17 TRINITY_DN42474_c0_g1_i1:32-340(-)
MYVGTSGEGGNSWDCLGRQTKNKPSDKQLSRATYGSVRNHSTAILISLTTEQPLRVHTWAKVHRSQYIVQFAHEASPERIAQGFNERINKTGSTFRAESLDN